MQQGEFCLMDSFYLLSPRSPLPRSFRLLLFRYRALAFSPSSSSSSSRSCRSSSFFFLFLLPPSSSDLRKRAHIVIVIEYQVDARGIDICVFFLKQSFKQRFETKLRFLVELQLNGKKYKVRNSDFLKNFAENEYLQLGWSAFTVAFRYIFFFFVRKISNNYNNNKCVPDIYSSKAKILIWEEVKIGSVALTLNEFLRGNLIVRNYGGIFILFTFILFYDDTTSRIFPPATCLRFAS